MGMHSVGAPGPGVSGVVAVVDGLVLVFVFVLLVVFVLVCDFLFLMLAVVSMNSCVCGTVSLASVSSTITSIFTSCTTLL